MKKILLVFTLFLGYVNKNFCSESDIKDEIIAIKKCRDNSFVVESKLNCFISGLQVELSLLQKLIKEDNKLKNHYEEIIAIIKKDEFKAIYNKIHYRLQQEEGVYFF